MNLILLVFMSSVLMLHAFSLQFSCFMSSVFSSHASCLQSSVLMFHVFSLQFSFLHILCGCLCLSLLRFCGRLVSSLIFNFFFSCPVPVLRRYMCMMRSLIIDPLDPLDDKKSRPVQDPVKPPHLLSLNSLKTLAHLLLINQLECHPVLHPSLLSLVIEAVH